MDMSARGAKHVDMTIALRFLQQSRRRASFELYTARSVQFIQRESRQLASDDASRLPRRFFRVVLDSRIYIILRLAMYIVTFRVGSHV
ncbi:hypothetical protein NEOLEDRAFT_1138392, partial [Neolentinus lepideus HHB14362 ss-1]